MKSVRVNTCKCYCLVPAWTWGHRITIHIIDHVIWCACLMCIVLFTTLHHAFPAVVSSEVLTIEHNMSHMSNQCSTSRLSRSSSPVRICKDGDSTTLEYLRNSEKCWKHIENTGHIWSLYLVNILSIIYDHLYTNIYLTWLELAAAATPAAPLPNHWAHGGQDGLGVLSMLDQENLTSLWIPLVFGTLVSFSGTWLEYASESPKNSGKTVIHSMKSTY